MKAFHLGRSNQLNLKLQGSTETGYSGNHRTFSGNISLDIQHKLIKSSEPIKHIIMQGSMYQIFHLSPTGSSNSLIKKTGKFS